jgi:hypothetical protein
MSVEQDVPVTGSICIFRPATEATLKMGVIVKTLQIFHYHYTVKDKAQEAVFFKILKYVSYKFISRSPEKGDTSQNGSGSLVLMA